MAPPPLIGHVARTGDIQKAGHPIDLPSSAHHRDAVPTEGVRHVHHPPVCCSRRTTHAHAKPLGPDIAGPDGRVGTGPCRRRGPGRHTHRHHRRRDCRHRAAVSCAMLACRRRPQLRHPARRHQPCRRWRHHRLRRGPGWTNHLADPLYQLPGHRAGRRRHLPAAGQLARLRLAVRPQRLLHQRQAHHHRCHRQWPDAPGRERAAPRYRTRFPAVRHRCAGWPGPARPDPGRGAGHRRLQPLWRRRAGCGRCHLQSGPAHHRTQHAHAQSRTRGARRQAFLELLCRCRRGRGWDFVPGGRAERWRPERWRPGRWQWQRQRQERRLRWWRRRLRRWRIWRWWWPSWQRWRLRRRQRWGRPLRRWRWRRRHGRGHFQQRRHLDAEPGHPGWQRCTRRAGQQQRRRRRPGWRRFQLQRRAHHPFLHPGRQYRAGQWRRQPGRARRRHL